MESKGVTKRKSAKAEKKSGAKEGGAEGVVKKPKSSRNTEKRRERSKVAARCRRGKESEIFTELSNCLPVAESSRSNLDKASVMRLTLCDLKMKQMLENVGGFGKELEVCSATGEENLFDALINSAVSGFVLVCSCDGDVIYVSEGIASCLGLSQYEVMGQSLLEFSHPCDQGDVTDMLLSSNNNKSVAEARSSLFRMKSTNSTRGRNAHHRSSNYKVVSCMGRIFSADIKVMVGGDEPTEEHQVKKWFVGICEPLLHPSDVDIPLNKQTFLSKHSPDMKFEYVDESISEFMGYKGEDMIGKSLFDFYHACDGDGISRSFRSLYTKGQTVTDRSRFLAKGGGWIWVVSQATTINNNAGKPTSVVCIHFVTSGVECDDEIVSHVQLRDPNEPIIPTKKPEFIPTVQPVLEKIPLHESTNLQNTNPIANPMLEEITAEPALIVNPFTGPIRSKPTPSTTKIFAPRTEDMDTGFLMPVNDTLIVTKDEPVDLTHLAPIAGDECVPLSNVPLLDDLLQWLDAADMEYTVLEGYEEPFPLPLISATGGSMIDSPIPIVGMTSDMNSVVKDDAMLDNMTHSPQNCDSPLLLSTDPTLLSSSDPMLLSPFKTPSPEPFSTASVDSPTCADLMSSDLFSTHYYSEHDTHGSRGGLTAGSSSHKSKGGGGCEDDDPFNGFPMVSDFQEVLLSPGGCLEGAPKPTSFSEVTVNLIDTGTGIDEGALKIKKDDGYIGLDPNKGFALMSKEPNIALGNLQCLARGNTGPNPEATGSPPSNRTGERPLPCKVAKFNFTDEHGNDKVWLQIPSTAPSQPPWDMGVNGAPQSQSHEVGEEISTRKRSNSITIGTQTQHVQEITRQEQIQLQRQQQLEKYQRLLMNPAVIQAIMLNRRLRPAARGGGATENSRKRNFVGELLANGGLLSNPMVLFDDNMESLIPTTANTGGGVVGLELPKRLVQLTNQDCEVNAPLNSQPLLDGPDILNALDT